MKVGFYYQIEASVHEGVLYMPALLGVFIEDLASRVEQLTLLVHIAPYDVNFHDFALRSNRIKWVNLGQKHNFPHRLLLGKKTLANLPEEAFNLDILLVRAPTPLAPALYSKFSRRITVAFMIVGDYSMQPSKRFSASWTMNHIYERIVNHRVLPHCLAMVNSAVLRNKYERICREVVQIKTTTLKKSDFFFRDDTCNGSLIHLLYVGRFDWQKGFMELFESIVDLKKNTDVRLHLVGWDTDAQKLNQKRMEKTILDFGISEQVVIEGYKKVGEELNKMYEMADVFVLPSYAEGFPRCIWEAMAHGVPVVATTVGGIPENLTDGENALLIPPHSTRMLTEAIEKIINNISLRQTIIKNGYALVNDATLEVQGERIVNILKNELENNKI
jgi:glycosyltransferase involved in cell wall biosynthesis